jgi:hypothetical protein
MLAFRIFQPSHGEKNMKRILVLLLLSALFTGTALAAGTPAHLKVYTATGNFDTVKDEVTLAITSRGLVIDHTSFIGNMLDRTGKDIGKTKKVYGKAEMLQFCSADISRRTMEADPSNIVFCPYVIAIYSLASDPKKVHVAFRRLQPVGTTESQASLKAVEDLLDSIVKEALGLKK